MMATPWHPGVTSQCLSARYRLLYEAVLRHLIWFDCLGQLGAAVEYELFGFGHFDWRNAEKTMFNE